MSHAARLPTTGPALIPTACAASVHAERARRAGSCPSPDDKRHAVGANHRPANALQEPKRDKREEIRRKAAERAGSDVNTTKPMM